MVGTIVLTGATGGLASIYAQRLKATRPDDHLVLFVRNPAKVKAGLLPAESSLVHYVPLDMGSIAGTHDAASFVKAKIQSHEWPSITALVCSAAVQVVSQDQPHKTLDGYEETAAVNHLAHYVLIRDLLPCMADGGRIIIIGSEGHRPDYKYWTHKAAYHPLEKQLEAPEEDPRAAFAYGLRRYGTSKLDQMMIGHESSLHVLMLDPGTMATGLFRSNPYFTRIFIGWAVRQTWLVNWLDPGIHATLPEQSAEMMLKLTTGDYTGVESLTPNGAPYWFSGGDLIECYGAATDERACEELWNDTAKLLGYPVDLDASLC